MKIIWQSLRSLFFFTILTGLIYPLAMTGLGQALMTKKANGSLIERNNVVVGSSLISQKFSKNEFFWPRPSGGDYNANPSGASNLGPTSSDLKKQIADRRIQLAKALNVEPAKIPQDLLTTSGSGLDPHVSPEGAKVQIARVVKARGLNQSGAERLNQLIDSLTEGPSLGILGENRVNVLKLNLALEEEAHGAK